MEKAKGVAIDEEFDAGKPELLGTKLRKGISLGRRGGLCTPVPAWKLEPDPSTPDAIDKIKLSAARPSATSLSARQLGANLWEIQDLLPMSKMSRRGGGRRRRSKDGKILGLPDLSPLSSPDQPQSGGSLRRNVAASLIQDHKLIGRSSQALQPASPAGYSSSMEGATSNLAITPSNSSDLKGRLGESGYSLKTSTELLKVLNRIWSLEEQHASNGSLVKALKSELEHARARIQQLMQEQQTYRHNIDDLMKQVAEDKLSRKSKEHDRIKAAVQSIRDELEDERRLRRCSESLHRKLGKEWSEVKSAFSEALKDLGRERKAHGLLEDLCDEFAKGVGDYEQEVRELKQKSDEDYDLRFDRLVLHISETWLDERFQMKLAEARGDLAEKKTIVDRLSGEIETFLQARRSSTSKNDTGYRKEGKKDSSLRRHSLESVHLNGTASAPQDAEDDDSITSDFHCFELHMDASDNEIHDHVPHGEKGKEKLEETRKLNFTRKKMECSEKMKGQSSSILQGEFEEQMNRTHFRNGVKMQLVDRVQGVHSLTDAETRGIETNPIGIVMPQKSANCDATEDGQDRKLKWDGMHASNYLVDNTMKKQSEFSEGCKVHPVDDLGEDSCNQFARRGHFVHVGGDNASENFCTLSSPRKQWDYRHTSPDLEISECSSKLPQGVKENTLKAKLLEARLEGQHARFKASKGSFNGGIQK